MSDPRSLSLAAVLAAISLLVPACTAAPENSAPGPGASPSASAGPATADGASLPFEESVAGGTRETADPGLAVGERAPSFTLPDQSGRPVSLESLLANGPVALVFSRSADWCLYCKMQLVQLEKNIDELRAGGGQVVGISYDPVAALKGFSDRSHISFPLLSDAGSKTIDAYRIRNTSGNAPEGVAFHATFIIDRTGVIRSKLFQVSYAERPAVENLVRELEGARRAGGG